MRVTFSLFIALFICDDQLKWTLVFKDTLRSLFIYEAAVHTEKKIIIIIYTIMMKPLLLVVLLLATVTSLAEGKDL